MSFAGIGFELRLLHVAYIRDSLVQKSSHWREPPVPVMYCLIVTSPCTKQLLEFCGLCGSAEEVTYGS